MISEVTLGESFERVKSRNSSRKREEGAPDERRMQIERQYLFKKSRMIRHTILCRPVYKANCGEVKSADVMDGIPKSLQSSQEKSCTGATATYISTRKCYKCRKSGHFTCECKGESAKFRENDPHWWSNFTIDGYVHGHEQILMMTKNGLRSILIIKEVIQCLEEEGEHKLVRTTKLWGK